MRHIILLTLALCLGSSVHARQPTGFFHTSGTQILDGDGVPAMKRGIGLGGWLMPEGYMIDYTGDKHAVRYIREKIVDLIGELNAEEFWRLYRANYVEEKDVAAFTEWGLDHIRLPLHYDVLYDIDTRTFKEEGFELLDTFLDWCRTHDQYVILDLHAAPGAQSEGDIADSDGTARLWTEPDPYQDMTVEFWVEIASRYADDKQIIGYDLINEPVTPDEVADGAQALRDLYGRLTEAVRAVDTNHILFIEGNYWATTFDKLVPPFDSNMVYAFHKYWNPTDQGTINYLLAIRDNHDVPLWLGETGENSNPWFHGMAKLMAEHDIGWNFWTHKQFESTAPPLSATITPAYRAVLDYWGGSGPRPSAAVAQDGLFGMAKYLDLDSTRAMPQVLSALMDPDFGTKQAPFVEHTIPGVVNAVHYDLGNQGVAYSDKGFAATSGGAGGGNNGGRYRNDGVDIEGSTDPLGYEFNVGWTESFEWMEYTVQVDTAGVFDVELRVASAVGGGTLVLGVDGLLGGVLVTPNTGGWQNWRSEWIRGVTLTGGEHVLRVSVGSKGDYNLNRMTFHLVTPTSTEDEAGLAEEAVDAYPSPASNNVTFRISSARPGTAHLSVFDLLGRRVVSRPVSTGSGIDERSEDVSGWAPGVYLYRLERDGTQRTGHFVVAR